MKPAKKYDEHHHLVRISIYYVQVMQFSSQPKQPGNVWNEDGTDYQDKSTIDSFKEHISYIYGQTNV